MSLKHASRPMTKENLGDWSDENSSTLKVAGLFALDSDGQIQANKAGWFLLNPTTWRENISSNWNPQTVPGQSNPPLHWTSTDARVVSFNALVTADTSRYVSGTELKQGENKDKPSLSKVFSGVIASAFAKTAPKPIRKDTGKLNTETNISLILDYYRSLVYPEYDNTNNPKKLRKSPPLVVLYVGSTLNKYPLGVEISSVNDIWVVTNLDINITKQHPNLAPMEAEVGFTLMQYNINSFSRRRFLEEN